MSDFIPDNTSILFDLRQTYALRILEPILLQIKFYRDSNDYRNWYEQLVMSLYTEIYQKLTTVERDEMNDEVEKLNETINSFPNTFKGTDKNIENVWKVKYALRRLETWMKDKMEKAGLYGKGFVYDEDEI